MRKPIFAFLKRTATPHIKTKSIAYVGYAFAHFFTSSLGQSFLLGMFFFSIGEDLNATSNEMSTYYVLATVASAFTIPKIGKYLDGISIQKFSLYSILGLFIVSALFSFTPSKWLLPIGFYGLRLFGQGLMPLIGSTGIARYFEKNRGKALSFSALGVTLAEGILPLFVPLLIFNFQWRMSFVLLATGISVVFVISVLTLIKKNSAFQKPKPAPEATPVSTTPILSGWFYTLVLAYIIPMFFLTGLFIHQGKVAILQGWDPIWFASSIAVYGIVRLIANLGAGFIVDWFTAKRVFAFALAPMLIGITIMWLTPESNFVILALGLCGVTASLGTVTNSALWAEIYGPQHLGMIKSKVSKFMIISTAVGTFYFGFMVERFDSLSIVLIPILLIGLAAMIGASLAIRHFLKSS